MQAVVLRGFGAPGVMELATAALPVPRRGEALVRVDAASVNVVDLKVRRGEHPYAAGAEGPQGPRHWRRRWPYRVPVASCLLVTR